MPAGIYGDGRIMCRFDDVRMWRCEDVKIVWGRFFLCVLHDYVVCVNLVIGQFDVLEM